SRAVSAGSMKCARLTRLLAAIIFLSSSWPCFDFDPCDSQFNLSDRRLREWRNPFLNPLLLNRSGKIRPQVFVKLRCFDHRHTYRSTDAWRPAGTVIPAGACWVDSGHGARQTLPSLPLRTIEPLSIPSEGRLENPIAAKVRCAIGAPNATPHVSSSGEGASPAITPRPTRPSHFSSPSSNDGLSCQPKPRSARA